MCISKIFALGGACAAALVFSSGCTTASCGGETGEGGYIASCCALKKDPYLGCWAAKDSNWWIGVKKNAAGGYTASILWGGSSPVEQDSAVLEGDALVITSCRQAGNARAYGKPVPALKPEQQTIDRTVMRVTDGVAMMSWKQTDGNGKLRNKGRTYVATRIPPPPPAPCLKSLKYGAPVDLLAGGMAAWEPMGDPAQRHYGWTMKDGVLSNRIARKPDGTPKHGDLNIRTKRADFEDFKLAYDVRVLPNCNSGVYLRGIYELQVLDSYGRSVDRHNMAAFYGRITPKVAAEKPANEWQHVEAILCDRHITVTLNGTEIIRNAPIEGVTGGALSSDEFKPGPIYLQGDHSDADFRNMVLTPIVK